MHPHLRHLSTALALALPLVVTATAAAALDTAPTGLPPVQTRASSGAVTADTSAVDHEEMTDSEHAGSVEETEHAEMTDSEHAGSVEETEHAEMTDSEHAGSVEDGHAPDAGSRPRALVLGSFGLVNAGVLVSAAVLRRRQPDPHKQRSAARATAPTAP